MSSAPAAIEERIREHVLTLAGTIGERNVFRSDALAAARDYIRAVFAEQGYRVDRQTYEAKGVLCANLEATLSGGAKPGQVLLLGAHYDTSPAVRAQMTTAAVWRHCWRSRVCSPAPRPR